MDQDSNQEPRKRLRTILSSQDDEAEGQLQPQEAPRAKTPLLRLPQRKSIASKDSDDTPVLARPASMPAREVDAPQEAAETPPPASPFADLKFGPPFWTITGILSLFVNAILIAILLVLFNRLDQLQSLQGRATNLGASVLGGMYTNFEKMDRAAIRTTIPVDANIPLDLTVPVKTTTQIILAEPVAIPNTRVEINTNVFTLDAPARVTLPAGTPLMVELDFDLPVQATIPVHLDVPVNIPMAETELHEPFVGLQEVVQPFYCMVEPNAFSLSGRALCR